MLLTLFALGGFQADRSVESDALALMRAWEARFERASIRFDLFSRDSTRQSFLLQRWPGIRVLRRVINESPIDAGALVDVYGEFTQLPASESHNASGIQVFGTETATEYQAYAEAIDQLLYDLGAVVAPHLSLSQAFETSAKRECARLPGGDIKIRFVASVDQSEVPITAVISHAFGGICEIIMRPGSDSRISRHIAVSWDARLKRQQLQGSTRYRDGRTRWKITSVDPMLAPPEVPSVPAGSTMLIEPFGYRKVVGETEQFDELRANSVLRSPDTPHKAEDVPRSVLCGPISLWYLAACTGKPIPFSAVLSKVGDHEFGTTLLQLQDAADALGLDVTAIRDVDKRLDHLPLPALLAVAPSHFDALLQAPSSIYWERHDDPNI